jgi:hypothetical protein
VRRPSPSCPYRHSTSLPCFPLRLWDLMGGRRAAGEDQVAWVLMRCVHVLVGFIGVSGGSDPTPTRARSYNSEPATIYRVRPSFQLESGSGSKYKRLLRIVCIHVTQIISNLLVLGSIACQLMFHDSRFLNSTIFIESIF